MAEITNPPPERRGIPLADLPEELVLDILLRLPPKSILQCRAVCKAWLCITTDRTFLLAHHGRQPAQRLLSFVRNVGSYGSGTDLRVVDYCVEAIDFRTREFRSVVRFTGNTPAYESSLEDDYPFTIHAACDGLLLMSCDDSLYICNPATRQWALVCPPALGDHKIAGLYVHGPSAEYRMLSYRDIDRTNKFFINTVGSDSVRCITFGSSSVSMRKWLARGSKATEFDRPFLSHGKLHWLPQSNPLKNILVFDTVAEEFSWLSSPVVTWDVVFLLEMEGTLAMSKSPTAGSKVDLWVLQDYKSAIWVHRYQIELPVAEICLYDKHESWMSKVVSPEGDVLVDCMDRLNWHLHYDIEGNLLRKFLCNGRLLHLTTHILKESLVPHAFFQMQEDGSAHEPPFFWGL
uniref:Uncharacterized protein n=1 Tax=Avena sativa TaxID=4498 RepID=A0ACD5X082_AVESA